MLTHRPLILAAGMLLSLIACTAPTPSPEPAGTATLIACDAMTPVPDRGSILPAFTPAYACELENSARHVDFCMNHASPELSYPCSQTESVQERAVGQGSQTVLIQHDVEMTRGCWHGFSSSARSLKVCNLSSGESTPLAEDVKGDPLPSPDKLSLAFVAAEPGSYGLKPHLFRVQADGSRLLRLDNQPFPQAQVLGASLLVWSEDGQGLDISLWDGTAGGLHRYRLRTDGSGQFEKLP